jgi:sirohydrochlorin ferrochelatase
VSEVAARALLLVDHGSRRAEANRVLDEVAAAVRARRPGMRVAIAHLELAEPGAAAAIDRLVANGAREITLQPCLLAPGRHAADDLARILREAGARHPTARFLLGEPLGAHAGVVDAVLARADSARSLPKGERN